MNETAPVRPGEELDAGRLGEYIRDNLANREIAIEQFPAGSSNLTYLVRVGGDEYVLRRPPFGNNVKTAHDIRREFNVLSKLSRVYTLAPRPLLFCDDETVIGSGFYLMERRHGVIIRGSVPPSLREPALRKGAAKVSGALDNPPTLSTEVCRSFIRNLVDLHALDYRAAGLADLGKPEGYNRRQVEGWTKRYFAAITHEHTAIESAIIWLNDSIPSEFGASLIHNDYKFDNVMLDPAGLTRITAVLDWEMVTVGDPLMDLGTTLGYWMSAEVGDEMLSMPFNPRVLMEHVTRQQLVESYADAAGRELPDMLFYYVFGTFKIAVIAQQIYARYLGGVTKDERFAPFGKLVGALGEIAARALDRGTI